ncbi:MAG: anthranilate phosphoribosyltransferase [Pseudomonadota bacterium]
MIHEAIAKAASGKNLTESEMMEAMDLISRGEATPAQIGALLVALRMKGECVDEIVGAVRVLRAKSSPIPFAASGRVVVDTCGTGGDGTGTFNVSTTAAFIAAGCGLIVAKHGNRSVSSSCGSADVLESLGVDLTLTPAQTAECLERLGLGFLFAPLLHPAMGHAVRPRREIKLKSIFNLVGPLTNPAQASVQIVGVFRKDLTDTLAQVLARLGCPSALVVHGDDGCDEITLTGPTTISQLKNRFIRTFTVSPEDLGLKRASLDEIKGGDAARNAAIVLDILEGGPGPRRDMALLNAAGVLIAAGAAKDFASGLELAARAVDSGRALEKLNSLVALTRELADRKKAVGE